MEFKMNIKKLLIIVFVGLSAYSHCADINSSENIKVFVNAARKGQYEIVENLLKAGIDPDSQVNHYSALAMAAANGHVSIVKLLLENSADVNKNYGDGSAIYCSIYGWVPDDKRNRRNQATELLLSHGAKIDLATAREAVAKNRYNVVERFLKDGANANPQNLDSLLRTAIHYGEIYAIKLLLDYGADPNLQDEEGNTALMTAVGQNNPQRIVKLLLDYNANPKIQNKKGQTIFDLVNYYFGYTIHTNDLKQVIDMLKFHSVYLDYINGIAPTISGTIVSIPRIPVDLCGIIADYSKPSKFSDAYDNVEFRNQLISEYNKRNNNCIIL